MHIRDWPIGERPREKLLARGAAALSDAELLAIFLGSGLPGLDAVATARQLLITHGPLRKLLQRSAKQLATLPGIGPARAAALRAALELGERHMAAELECTTPPGNPATAAHYFARRLRDAPREIFAAMFFDSRLRSLGFEELFYGTLDRSEVHPRELVRRALDHKAAAVIVGHNHPSGNPEPSAADKSLTSKLKKSLALMDIRLLDHFVIGDGAPVSMAARGLL